MDELDIPVFLRREMTPEIAKRLKKITAKHRERKIKSPWHCRKAKGLGAAFGTKITVR